jgi:8-oxo-dGTP pyrophosphatase MutT (NUDIX family)
MMIDFDAGEGRFLCRAAGVVLRDGSVMFERGECLFLPGGRVELQETVEEAMARELREELGVPVQIERLLWIVENFFIAGTRQVHELGFYFLCSPPQLALRFEAGRVFEWHSLAAIPSLDVRPSFLKTALAQLPSTPQRLVVREGMAPIKTD